MPGTVLLLNPSLPVSGTDNIAVTIVHLLQGIRQAAEAFKVFLKSNCSAHRSCALKEAPFCDDLPESSHE